MKNVYKYLHIFIYVHTFYMFVRQLQLEGFICVKHVSYLWATVCHICYFAILLWMLWSVQIMEQLLEIITAWRGEINLIGWKELVSKLHSLLPGIYIKRKFWNKSFGQTPGITSQKPLKCCGCFTERNLVYLDKDSITCSLPHSQQKVTRLSKQASIETRGLDHCTYQWLY